MPCGNVFVSEEEELKDFYLVTEGILQQVAVGQKYDVKVFSKRKKFV